MGPFWSAQGTTGPHWTEMAVEFSTETLKEEGGADGTVCVSCIYTHVNVCGVCTCVCLCVCVHVWDCVYVCMCVCVF